MQETIKPPVEVRYQAELEALKNADKGEKKPDNWQMSPKAVRTFILGSDKPVKYQRKSYQIKNISEMPRSSSDALSHWLETAA